VSFFNFVFWSENATAKMLKKFIVIISAAAWVKIFDPHGDI